MRAEHKESNITSEGVSKAKKRENDTEERKSRQWESPSRVKNGSSSNPRVEFAFLVITGVKGVTVSQKKRVFVP